jgi:hypothetical protein
MDDPMKPLITCITPKKLSNRAHEATGCETPPFLSPRGIQNHHKKKAYEHKHTECEECIDEDEDNNGYTDFPTFEYGGPSDITNRFEFAETDGIPSAGLIFRNNQLEAEEESTVGADLDENETLLNGVKCMLWQDCQFGEVAEGPRVFDMCDSNWSVARNVVDKKNSIWYLP